MSNACSWRVGRARWLAASLWLVGIVGLALWLTVRDRFQPWAVGFYMTPAPVLAVLFVLAGWMWPGGKCRKTSWRPWRSLRGLSVAAGCACAVWTWWTEFPAEARPAPATATRIAYWNVGHCRMGVKRIAAEIGRWDRPIVALVEADVKGTLTEELWRAELPGYTIAASHAGELVAVKGDVTGQQEYALTPFSSCSRFDVAVDGRELTVLIVDIASNLLVSRREAMEKLAGIVAGLNDRPVLIVGDFNTPDSSVWFEPLRQCAKSGMRTAGTGYAPSWPMPLPVLTLDQLWFNERCEVFSCHCGWTVLSDHRPLFAEVQPPVTSRH